MQTKEVTGETTSALYTVLALSVGPPCCILSDFPQFEIKAFLEAVHGMEVERVNTINYLGKKRRVIHNNRQYWKRESDWKKAYVIFRPPKDDAKVQELVTQWQQQKEQKQLEAYQAWKQQRHDKRQTQKQQMASLMPTLEEAEEEAAVIAEQETPAAADPIAAAEEEEEIAQGKQHQQEKLESQQQQQQQQ